MQDGGPGAQEQATAPCLARRVTLFLSIDLVTVVELVQCFWCCQLQKHKQAGPQSPRPQMLAVKLAGLQAECWKRRRC